jgi:hypothetical protein
LASPKVRSSRVARDFARPTIQLVPMTAEQADRHCAYA